MELDLQDLEQVFEYVPILFGIQLAFGLIGSAIGSQFTLFGFSLAGLGQFVGTTLANLLFPPDPIQTFGPRLTDLKVSDSQYGGAIPIGYGTIKTSGNVIFADDIEEVETTEEIGGKGFLFGGGQEHTSYTYFLTYGIGLAYREADDVIRIWFNEKKWLDRRPGNRAKKAGLNFTFYPGSQTQVANAQMKDSFGAENVSANRGLCYIVFKRLPLKDLNNTMPNTTVEVAFAATPTNTAALSVGLTDSTRTSMDNDGIFVDRKRRRVYYVANGAFLSSNIIKTNELNEIRLTEGAAQDPPFNVGSGTEVAWLPEAQILVSQHGSLNSRLLDFINIETMTLDGKFGVEDTDLTPDFEHIQPIERHAELTAIDPSGRGNFHWLFIWTSQDDVAIIIINDGGPFENPPRETAYSMLYTHNGANPFGGVGKVRYSVGDKPHKGEGVAWIVSGENASNDDMQLWKLTVPSTAKIEIINDIADNSVVKLELWHTFTSSTWGGIGQGGQPVGPVIDRTDGGMIFIKGTTTGSTVWKFDPDVETRGAREDDFETIRGKILWRTNVTSGRPNGQDLENSWLRSDMSGDTLAWIDGSDNITYINTTDGEIILDNVAVSSFTGPSLNTLGGHYWDGETQSLITALDQDGGGNELIGRIFLDLVVADPETLDVVVGDLNDRAGVATIDRNVTALAGDDVRGVMFARQMPARTAIETLMPAYQFDARESDHVIEYVKLTDPSVMTIPEANLVTVKDGPTILEQRREDVKLVETLTVAYFDIDRDYEEGAASVKRVRQPDPGFKSMFARATQTVEMPIVFSATEARQVAEQILYSIWNERVTTKITLPQQYMTLDPVDIITIELDSGATIKTRLQHVQFNTDFTIELEGIGAETAIFSPVFTSDGGDGFVPDTIEVAKFTQTFLLDIPLLRDVDATGGVVTRSYVAMNGFEDNWPGGTLFESVNDGQSFFIQTSVLKGAAIGFAINRLPKTNIPFQTDKTTQLEILMPVGSDLISVVTPEFLNNANVALVGNQARNNWEIILFENASRQVEDDRYLLTNIIRGKRGTDIHVNSHIDGETVIILERSTINAFINELTQIGVSNQYRGVGRLQNFDESDIQFFTGTGADLKPYAPVELGASLDGSSNIDFIWTRRTRLAGELRDLVDVPLGEATELYDVVILDKPTFMGGTSQHELLALTSETGEMLNADVTTKIPKRASGLLTLTANPLNDETVVLDTKTYTFQTTLTNVDGNVLIGADQDDSLANLIAAMDLSAAALEDKVSGTHYAGLTVAHTTITSKRTEFTGEMAVLAGVGGTGGNSLATTETLSNGDFGSGVLIGGTDASLPDEVDFIVYQKGETIGRGFGREIRLSLV